jgi:hypothetical protein
MSCIFILQPLSAPGPGGNPGGGNLDVLAMLNKIRNEVNSNQGPQGPQGSKGPLTQAQMNMNQQQGPNFGMGSFQGPQRGGDMFGGPGIFMGGPLGSGMMGPQRGFDGPPR